jgi:protein involved in polysaccharide export with SLBB domain
MLRTLVVVACLWAVACGNRAQVQSPTTDAALTEVATLGPGDLFEVRVFGQEDLNGKYKVAADGTIEFPFLGTVQAGGKQPEELARVLQAQLKDGGFLKDPHVSVLAEDSTSRRVSVLGAVQSPGTFPIVQGMTVVQAISQAGGFTPFADKDGVLVTRRVEGKLERFQVRVKEISKGTQPDLPLRVGDIVFVPERMF